MPVIDIKSVEPSDYPFVFCDANIWIAALKVGKLQSEKFEYPYVQFFSRIVEINALAHSGDKKIFQCKHIPKIVFTSLLLSEIINTYMRNVAMPLNFPGINCKGVNFKSAYRDDPNSNYKKYFSILIDDLVSYYESDCLALFDDKFTKSQPIELLKAMHHSMDFNDYFYFQHFKNEKIPILSADKDFKYLDCLVIRSHNRPSYSR
jgi:hypothetical protein